MIVRPIGYTTKELYELGETAIPSEFQSSKHLIYSSPATLAFNSPGAEGYGVKRAGLAVPDSVMLLVAPGCCGHNTSLVSRMPQYHNRFFYLMMNETDIVTGRHLNKIPKAVEEVIEFLPKKPSVVMICITCVDALLGTDMERVCRKAEERVGLPVKPCYMYALTREGRKPPMVHVRDSLYSLLEPRKKRGTSVNILGYFGPLIKDCELHDLLKQIGVKTIREIGTCQNYDEFQMMAEANFNLILNHEARYAAQKLENRLKIPSIELRRLYRIDKIKKQYDALFAALGAKVDDSEMLAEAQKTVEKFRNDYPELTFSVGECANADPFELSLALIEYGYKVNEIYGTITRENFIYLKLLQELSPDTMVYSNLEPTMIGREIPDKRDFDKIDKSHIAIGKDAGYYHPDHVVLPWNQDEQPFGYAGVKLLFNSLRDAIENADNPSEGISFTKEYITTENNVCTSEGMKTLRKYLTPFAPDGSGAVGVLYELGGLSVIADAGGCAGNICGFDEPRWFTQKSAVFSAGMRDMDAIFGHDDRLVAKMADAADKLGGEFIAVIGTPVPAVIGMDGRALEVMLKRKTDLPVIPVDTTGIALYDSGEERAYIELFRKFADKEVKSKENNKYGIIGVTPLNFSDVEAGNKIKDKYMEMGINAKCYGMGAGLEDIKNAGCASKNIVTSVSGLSSAKYLKETFGTEYEAYNPLAVEVFMKKAGDIDMNSFSGKRVLIVHEQITANTLRDYLQEQGAEVTNATWFNMEKSLEGSDDKALKEETDFIKLVNEGSFDVLICDQVLWQMVRDYEGIKIDYPHFAVSGRLVE